MIDTQTLCDLINNPESVEGGTTFLRKVKTMLRNHNKVMRNKTGYMELLATIIIESEDKVFDDWEMVASVINTSLVREYRQEQKYKNTDGGRLEHILREEINKHARDYTPNLYTYDFIQYVKTHTTNHNIVELLELVINIHIKKCEWATRLNISMRQVRKYERQIRELHTHYSAL